MSTKEVSATIADTSLVLYGIETTKPSAPLFLHPQGGFKILHHQFKFSRFYDAFALIVETVNQEATEFSIP